MLSDMVNGMTLYGRHPEPPELVMGVHGEEIRFFHSKHQGLHNCYNTRFVLQGHVFTTVEQYVAWQKAKLFGDYEIADKILDLTNPVAIRRWAARVRGFDLEKWRMEREKVGKFFNLSQLI